MPSIEELTVEEQVRLAQAAGVLPVGLRPSEVRQRKVQPNGSKAKEPLINQIPSQIDGATIHHVPIEAMDSQEEEEEDEDEDEDENEDYDDGAEMMRQRKRVEEQRPPDFADEIFNVIMYLIPYSTLFLMLDILSHKQYSQHPEIDDYAIRLLQAIPSKT
ncbi:hypothetical protein QFC22_003025 [Naganishia vaughanmartiniae]|uniref:Uncharacterized protein n=1 Tax=Naganishia vaughanmartiniae TaxID=1424756 RepID=A0ACC2X891_9TREE|nr:hypothetical protein QFC22_003025 [Naganishia vaughanmartiniae]